MPDFSKRSYQEELLDRDDIPFEDIKQNMKELDSINSYLGGHQITIKGISSFLSNRVSHPPRVAHPKTLTISKRVSHPQKLAHPKTLIICEIGCGGGDNLRVIKKWCTKKSIPVKLIGIDINPHCIDYAGSRKENEGIEFITSDYRVVNFEQQPDILFSSLFCHHFTDEELQQQFTWMSEQSQLGFFVNDLHRHFLAYHFIKTASSIFSTSYLVKNDAPLSVARGFSKNELQNILQKASIHHYQLKWKWAFRWLLIVPGK